MNKNKTIFSLSGPDHQNIKNHCTLVLRLLSCRLALLKKETDNSVWSFTFPYPMYNSFQYFFTANVWRHYSFSG